MTAGAKDFSAVPELLLSYLDVEGLDALKWFYNFVPLGLMEFLSINAVPLWSFLCVHETEGAGNQELDVDL